MRRKLSGYIICVVSLQYSFLEIGGLREHFLDILFGYHFPHIPAELDRLCFPVGNQFKLDNIAFQFPVGGAS